jgi:hypothetical protein
MSKVSWIDRVRNCYIVLGGEEYRTNNKRNEGSLNWCHSLRRNCLLKHVIGGKIERRIEVTGRRGRRRSQLLDDLEERRGY